MITRPKSGFVFSPSHFLVLCSLVIGLFGRFLLMSRGHNYDFDSYRIVVDANRQDITAWQTNRYNYGPIWWYLLRFFDWTSRQTGLGFRNLIVVLLTSADLVIAYFICKCKGLALGSLFFINPISIIITGYHNQFDNVSIAIVCLAVLRLKNEQSDRLNLNNFFTVLLLGTSLATKHIFVFFIVWVAIRQKTSLLKFLYLLGPFLVFGVSFVPYLGTSWDSIKLNVFEYRSKNNAPLLHVLWKIIGVDGEAQLATIFFIVSMFLIGLVLRKARLENSIFIYCIVVVALSPGIANQYLAIAAFGAIGLFNLGFAMYFIYGSYWLAVHIDGLRLGGDGGMIRTLLFAEPGLHSLMRAGYSTFPILLIFGLLIVILKSKLQTRNA